MPDNDSPTTQPNAGDNVAAVNRDDGEPPAPADSNSEDKNEVDANELVEKYGFRSSEHAGDQRCFKRDGENNAQCLLVAGHGQTGRDGDPSPHVFSGRDGELYTRL